MHSTSFRIYNNYWNVLLERSIKNCVQHVHGCTVSNLVLGSGVGLRKETISTGFIYSHVCLKNRVLDFWNMHLFYFNLQANIFGDEKLLPPAVANRL